MSRVSPASFACALALSLFLPGLPTYALPQTQSGDVKPSTAAVPQNKAAANQNPEKQASKQAGKETEPLFQDVPFDSPLYADVDNLQKQGVITGYPEGYFRGRRPLTAYEFAVAAERIVKDWDVLTLAPDGKTLKSVIAIPRNLSREQAQTLLEVWTKLRFEIGVIGVGAAKTDLIIRTLQTYVNLIPNNMSKFKADIGVFNKFKADIGVDKKEPKQ